MYGQNGQMFPNNMSTQQRLQYMEQMYPQYGNQMPMNNQMNQQPPQQYQQQQMQQPMMQQNNQFSMQQQIPQNNIVKCRAVTNIDEARAATIDFDGTLYVFPDTFHHMIYTKQISTDGTPSFRVFVEQPDMPTQQQMIIQQPQIDIDELKSGLVNSDEFNSFKQNVYNKLTDITEKYNAINEALGGVKNE